MVLLLLQALYGLRVSPLLWYKDLTKALEELGLKLVPDVNCLFTNKHLVVFFYVDDIVVLARKQNLEKLDKFEALLLDQFEIRAIEELKWFLGIQVESD